MAPTPSSKPNHSTQLKTPHSKHRLNFNGLKTATPLSHPSPNPNSAAIKEAPPEHPIEVIARIRDYPDRKDKPLSVLQINSNLSSIRVRADFGYRDFTLDGVSVSEEEDLDAFYKKFVESRIHGIKLGEKCTIMMYGPTGSGKSHTMFGCSKQAGIVYRSLRDILGDVNADGEGDSKGEHLGLGTFVQVTVLEIYNEEIYDLLSTSGGGGGFGFGWPKGSSSKVKLEVMGKKAKNATYISGNEAGKISKEIQKVEKRRIVKSTLCNDRSSRSHCMVILDVPTVGGRLMLVDMAGSENIEQAGQTGFEAKMQTAKINQGNTALKRVVESIANGDSHVPFRDSKLTMLLQDSFEDDKSKILMILCASPDPKEIHKTITTLEYGAKAKCIVRGPHTPPVKDDESSSAVILGSRIAAMDEFISKLQMENKQREKERNEAHKKLLKKEEEIALLRTKLDITEKKGTPPSEEEINLKVNERTRLLRQELEKKLEECQRMTNEFVEQERKRMEERILQQQEEVEFLRKRLEEIELQLCSRKGCGEENESKEVESSGFVRRLLRIYKSEDDPGMVKSMDLDMDDQEPPDREVKIVGGVLCRSDYKVVEDFSNPPCPNTLNGVQEDAYVCAPNLGQRTCLSTVYEEEEEEEGEGEQGYEDKGEEEEVEKEVIEEKRVCTVDKPSAAGSLARNSEREDYCFKGSSEDDDKDSRLLRIQNIFTLCGNQRELSQHIGTPIPTKKRSDDTFDLRFSPLKTSEKDPLFKISNKENLEPQKTT
ncbi:kinesin-like protein KIN-10A [Gastrolobium bilobum]|uniref:kinesin-like protein KIN-10A n=1 Tax=Gastrolobium bilobum TaxID=150636 RepID=UPI002AB1EBB9|nr:kinesin-like protein KIN-10A [Gastrolobium bilobum]